MTRPPGEDRRRASRARGFREALLAYGLLLPSALVLGGFGLLPVLNALWLSTQRWRLVPEGPVGLDNYRALFAAPEFWQSLGVTLWYVVGTVPPALVLGYLIAELLHARIRGLALYRTAFFVPYVVSPVAAAAVWRWMLNPNFGIATAVAAWAGWHPTWLQEQTGIFTLAAAGLGVELPGWAGGPSLALACIIAVSVWHNLGFAVVVLLAGLSAVPTDLTDAARLDGARGWSLLRRVKLPLVSPTLFFLLVVFSIRAFQTFSQVYVMSIDHRGGPAGTTRNLSLYIYQSFNENAPAQGPGYGSAVAVVLFLIILALTLLQFRVVGRRVHYG